MKSVNSLPNQRGMIVMQLVALGLLGLSVVGVLSVGVLASNYYQKSQILELMIEKEDSLLGFSQNFSEIQKIEGALRGGTSPNGHRVELKGNLVSVLGQVVQFDQQGRACTQRCSVSVESHIRCDLAKLGAQCWMAYRIRSLTALIQNMGASHANPFVVADYTIPISSQNTRRQLASDCANGSTTFAIGMDKETGVIACASLPQQRCQPGQVAKGLAWSTASNSFEPICENLQTVSCPANYVLNQAPTTSFRNGQAKSGQCVFVTRDQVPWRMTPPPAPSISGTFCPTNYRTQATCNLTNVQATPGICSYQCNCVTTLAGTTCQTCECRVDPVPGQVTMTDGSQQASCSVVVPAQPSCSQCSAQAQWRADAQMTGQCLLNPSPTAAVQ